MLHISRRLVAVTTLAAAGTFAVAGGASADDDPTDADVEEEVDQDASSNVSIYQKAWTNTGLNLAFNWTEGENDSDQESDADANGGDADAGGGRGPSLINGFNGGGGNGPSAVGGGDGGTADATNDNDGTNDATSDNVIDSGDADASNSVGGTINQSATNTSSNSATATAGANTSTATAGNATSSSSTANNAEADVDSDVHQDQSSNISVNQEAGSNSGLNAAGNVTSGDNDSDQDADSNANGGEAEGDADAVAGGNGGDGHGCQHQRRDQHRSVEQQHHDWQRHVEQLGHAGGQPDRQQRLHQHGGSERLTFPPWGTSRAGHFGAPPSSSSESEHIVRRIKTVAAVALVAVFAFHTPVLATSEPPASPQEESSSPETPPATEATTTEAPTTAAEAPSTAPEGGTTTTYIDPAITEAIIETPVEETTTTNAQVNQNQEVVITATVVADANSGSNTVLAGTSVGSSTPNEIDTGDATAVGSDDANVVTQGADITLEDQATANVIQVALIINVGVAFANSGYNNVGATQGAAGLTGGIVTGDASAEGLDIDQYITQASRENGDEDTDAHSNQLAISLWMGLGTANTGLNNISGPGVAAGGSVSAGSASATGNISTTDIEQYADLLGEDSAHLNVEQRATVLNVGFALANSGINDISGVAGGILSADPGDDNEYAQDLFAMLLPALLQSYGYGPAGGSINSGNATAVGNDSDTFIRQVALAASSGDGVVDIVQQVLVANMGAAGANTGGNTLGGGVATLDSESASAIVLMAAFMSEMLALVHQEANGEVMSAQSRGIEVPFQGLLLRLDATFEGLDTTFTNESGASANLRQVTIVVSLGLANSNTGNNTAITQGNVVNELQAGDSIQVLDANGDFIGTGAAEADADQLVVVCQRINADDVECLAPPTTTVPPGDTPTTTPGTPTTTQPGGPTTDPGASVPGTSASPNTPSTPGDPGGPSGFGPAPGTPGYTPQGMLPATGADPMLMIALALSAIASGMVILAVMSNKNVRNNR